MRTENLKRLSEPTTSKISPTYLVYKSLFRDLKYAISNHATGDILDIGCGNKPYTSFFEDYITSYTGCDIVQSDGKQVDVICPATNIPLADNSKDTVFSTQVIEHVADHMGLLSEAFRILKPGGKVIISGPMHWEHHEEPYDFFRFTKYGFEYIFEKTGFIDINVIPNGGKWACSGQLLQNNIRSSFLNKQSFKAKTLKLFYTIFRIKWIINSLFSWLDDKDTDYSATLNFVVVAQKPANS